MSESQSQPKLTVYSTMTVTQSDLEVKMGEVKIAFYRLVIYTVIDFILSIILNTHECHLYSSKDFDVVYFIIKSAIITVILLIFFLLLLLYNPLVTSILKKFYLLFALLYFFYKLFIHIKSFIDDFNSITAIDLLFFFITLITIIPRVVFYYYLDTFLEKLTQMMEIRKCEDHDKFVENLGNKMDRGQDTKWSENSLSFDREKNRDLTMDKDKEKDKEKGMERQSEFKLVTINTHKNDNFDNNFHVEEDHFKEDKNE